MIYYDIFYSFLWSTYLCSAKYMYSGTFWEATLTEAAPSGKVTWQSKSKHKCIDFYPWQKSLFWCKTNGLRVSTVLSFCYFFHVNCNVRNQKKQKQNLLVGEVAMSRSSGVVRGEAVITDLARADRWVCPAWCSESPSPTHPRWTLEFGSNNANNVNNEQLIPDESECGSNNVNNE